MAKKFAHQLGFVIIGVTAPNGHGTYDSNALCIYMCIDFTCTSYLGLLYTCTHVHTGLRSYTSLTCAQYPCIWEDGRVQFNSLYLIQIAFYKNGQILN